MRTGNPPPPQNKTCAADPKHTKEKVHTFLPATWVIQSKLWTTDRVNFLQTSPVENAGDLTKSCIPANRIDRMCVLRCKGQVPKPNRFESSLKCAWCSCVDIDVVLWIHTTFDNCIVMAAPQQTFHQRKLHICSLALFSLLGVAQRKLLVGVDDK